MNTSEPDGYRQAVRAILLTPDSRVLLLRYQEPDRERRLWLTPGGGLEPGESDEAALRRELREETGLARAEIGPIVWWRYFASKRLRQHERFFLVRTQHFEPHARQLEADEIAIFREFRWWRVEEIATSPDVFGPRGLARYLAALVREGPPPTPLDVGL